MEGNILGVIGNKANITRKEIAAVLGISTGVVKEYLNKLKEKGLLERQGNNRTDYWKINRK